MNDVALKRRFFIYMHHAVNNELHYTQLVEFTTFLSDISDTNSTLSI